MSLIDFREQVLKLTDFNEAFELVKLAVNAKFNMHRAGLSLILQGLPSRIGAYHILGSNVIVVNRTILNIIRQHKSIEEYNSYLFMVLAHEYLHSFGIVDEFRVRQMAYDLCSSLLGNEHPASIMAKEDPSALFPELSLLRQNKFDEHFEVVKNFDKLLLGANGAEHIRAEGFALYVLDEFLDDLIIHIGVEERAPNIAHDVRDVSFGQARLSTDFFIDLFEPRA